MKSLTEGQIFTFFLFNHGLLLVVTLQCQSPQYITLGQQGIIECPFPPQFTTIAWSDSASQTATPVIKIASQGRAIPEVSGDGYDSGEYNMSLNGSLIIRTSTINTDRIFRVLLVYVNATYTSANVSVRTIVRPSQRVPDVSLCEIDDHCFVSSKTTDILNCTYTGARPAVNLTWYKQINNENEYINTNTATVDDSNYTMMSTSTLDISDFTDAPLNVFTCEASGPALGFQEVSRSVFVYDIEKSDSSINETNDVQLNESLKISCKKKQSPTAFVWSFRRQDTSRLLVISSNSETDVIDNLNKTFQVSKDGTLHFMHVDRQLEGIFTCVFLEAGESSFNSIRVTTVDKAAPGEFPIIVVIIIVLIIIVVVLCCVVYRVRIHMQSRKREKEYDAVAKEEVEEAHRDEEESIEMPKYDKPEPADKPEEETSLHSTTNEPQEQQNDEVNDSQNVSADPNEELPPNGEEDCPADAPEDSSSKNPDSPETEQGASDSGTAVGATLSYWVPKVGHEDKQVDSIQELAKGDHIVFFGYILHPRCHGIVVDTNIERNELGLVRFTYQKGVIEEWKKWKPPIYKVLKYHIGNKTLGSSIYDPDAVVERARKMVGNTNLIYNIAKNNCKTFATWCKTDAMPDGYGYD